MSGTTLTASFGSITNQNLWFSGPTVTEVDVGTTNSFLGTHPTFSAWNFLG